MKKRILITFLFVFMISIGCVSAAEDINQTSDNIKDMDTLSVSENIDVIGAKDDGTFTALQEKIDNAAAGSTITLENDYKYDEEIDSNLSYSFVMINKSISIDGAGYSIDGDNQIRIFGVYGQNVKFDNINFKNAYASSGGGAAIFSKYDLNIGDNNSFYDNNCNGTDRYSGFGGAVYVIGSPGSKLTIGNGNKFINNAAYRQGGAIWAQNILIGNNNVFSNNTCNGKGSLFDEISFGGAIYCDGDLDLGSFNNFTFNTVEKRGGAIYALSHVNMGNNNLFINNRAEDGGAIFSSTVNAIKTVFINNTASHWGGAINAQHPGSYPTTLNITFSIFDGNHAESSDAIHLSTTNRMLYSNFWGSNNPDFNSLLNGWSPEDYIKLEISDLDAVKWTDTKFNLYFNSILPDYTVSLSTTKGTVKPKTVKITDGSGFFVLNTDEDTIISVYNNEGSTILSKSINISDMKLDVPDVTKEYGGPESLQVTLTEGGAPVSNAKINININGGDYTRTTDSDGKALMPINLNAGSYIATVSFQDIISRAIVTVNKLATKTSLVYTKNGYTSVTLTASVNPSSAGGRVTFDVNGNDYTATVSDAKATYTLNNLAAGSYDVKAIYDGDVNHEESSSSSVKFDVEDHSIIVSAPDVIKYYGGDERFVVTVTDNAGNPIVNEPVKVTINGQPYDRKTGADGRTTFAINLRSGTHEATTEHAGDVIKSTITVKTTVVSKNITKIFRNGTNYEASFLDKKGNKAPAGEKVSININGVFYHRTIKSDGSISFALNLEQGTYVLTLTNPYTGEEISNTVKILPNIVENKDLVKYYRNGSQFTFKLLDDKGNPVAGQKASININGVFYTRTTNDKGIATFQINLEPGTYILTMDYKGCRVSNRVTVLSVIQSSDIKMKYQDGTRFKVTILDGVGKPYAKQNVTFNINGVFYYRTTKDDGSTSLAINLMAGEYIITTTYNSLNVSNKVTISS